MAPVLVDEFIELATVVFASPALDANVSSSPPIRTPAPVRGGSRRRFKGALEVSMRGAPNVKQLQGNWRR